MKLLFTKMKMTVREVGFFRGWRLARLGACFYMLSLRYIYLPKWRSLIGSWTYKTEIQEITLGVTGI